MDSVRQGLVNRMTQFLRGLIGLTLALTTVESAGLLSDKTTVANGIK